MKKLLEKFNEMLARRARAKACSLQEAKCTLNNALLALIENPDTTWKMTRVRHISSSRTRINSPGYCDRFEASPLVFYVDFGVDLSGLKSFYVCGIYIKNLNIINTETNLDDTEIGPALVKVAEERGLIQDLGEAFDRYQRKAPKKDDQKRASWHLRVAENRPWWKVW